MNLGDIRILIVDDEPHIREIIKTICSEFTSNTYEAENGIHAQQIINQNKIDFVITDINMPEMNGLELLDWLSKTMPHISTLVVSSENRNIYIQQTIMYGTVDYLEKPVSTEHLHYTIKKTLFQILLQKQMSELLELNLYHYSKSIKPSEFKNLSDLKKFTILDKILAVSRMKYHRISSN